MIRFQDALMLARTKRRTRKIRTGLTILISSLLFSLLVGALFIVGGVQSSADQFLKESMSGRYVTQGMVAIDGMANNQLLADPAIINEVTKRYDKLVADKTREAKRLGVPYDPASEPRPYDVVDKSTGEKMLSNESEIAQTVLNEEIDKRSPLRTLDDFKKYADQYHPTAYYESRPFRPSEGMIKEMKDGKEATADVSASMNRFSGAPPDLDMADFAPSALLSLYYFKTPTWKAESGHIPVVVSQKRAASLTSYSPPDEKAPAEKRLNYLQELRKKAQGMTFSACYRNATSMNQMTMAQATQKELKQNANNKEYQKPAVIRSLPDPSSCGEAAITTDTRTAAEKAYAAKEDEFKRLFDRYAGAPAVQHKLTFEVVGVGPNSLMDQEFGTGVESLIAGMFAGQTFRMAIPQEMFDQLPDSVGFKSIFDQKTSAAGDANGMQPNFYAEFDTPVQARALVDNESCQYTGDSMGCEPKEKVFTITPFGSNSLALESAVKGIRHALVIVGIVITALAAVICGLTIGRTIADGRREAAVFRAIGFKRGDIAQTYIMYAVLLGIDIVIVAFLVGFAGAVILDQASWLGTTAQVRLLLGASESSTEFHYVGWSLMHIAVIAAICVSVGLGMIIPLLQNIRRNPIRDMRDE